MSLEIFDPKAGLCLACAVNMWQILQEFNTMF